MKSTIIIIGLPGSGKTTYANDNLSKTHKIYDDCLFNWYSKELIDDINNKNNIVLIDPRLSNLDTFFKYIRIILSKIDRQDIELIVYDNDVDHARNNLNNSKTHHTILEHELISFHDQYKQLLDSMEFRYTTSKIKTTYNSVYKDIV